MSRSIVFRRVAKSELDDAVAWYENKEEGLGIKFIGLLPGNLSALLLHPNSSPVYVVKFAEHCCDAFRIRFTF